MNETIVTTLLTQVVIPLAGLVVTFLLGKLVNTINKKYHMDITQKEVENAVNFAERLAANAAKNGLPKVTSGQKMQEAVNYVNKVVPQKDQEQLKKAIEAAVQKYRGNGCDK